MEEKVLIRGERYKTNGITTVLCILAAIYMAGCFIASFSDPENLLGLPIGLVFLGIGMLFLKLLNSAELIVTDKRVYGKTAFGKTVDLPLDSISAVGTGVFNRISVATSAGQIHFYEIENREAVYNCINQLLIKRQNSKPKPAEVKIETPLSNADELKKYKDLLDSGVITQEEFAAKKKQLLGL